MAAFFSSAAFAAAALRSAFLAAWLMPCFGMTAPVPGTTTTCRTDRSAASELGCAKICAGEGYAPANATCVRLESSAEASELVRCVACEYHV